MRAGGPISVALGALLGLACAGGAVRPQSAPWRFPARYQATQVVKVAGSEGDRDFLASVACDGDRVEVVLFDPVLQMPLLRAAAAPGETEETAFMEGVPTGNGRKLVELIQAMNELSFQPRGSTSHGAVWDGWDFTLTELSGPPACRFPGRILLEHRYGGPLITVETTDVGCGDPSR